MKNYIPPHRLRQQYFHRTTVTVLLWATLTLPGCLKPTQPSVPQEITSIQGTIALPDSLRTFAVVIAFVPDYLIFNATDTITSIGVAPPYEFIELHVIAGPASSRSFSINLPEDKSGNRGVIAWVDKNANLQLELSTEPARFPTKTYNNAGVVVTRWTYGFNSNNRLDYSLVLVRNSGTSTAFLSQLGNAGFRFSF